MAKVELTTTLHDLLSDVPDTQTPALGSGTAHSATPISANRSMIGRSWRVPVTRPSHFVLAVPQLRSGSEVDLAYCLVSAKVAKCSPRGADIVHDLGERGMSCTVSDPGRCESRELAATFHDPQWDALGRRIPAANAAKPGSPKRKGADLPLTYQVAAGKPMPNRVARRPTHEPADCFESVLMLAR